MLRVAARPLILVLSLTTCQALADPAKGVGALPIDYYKTISPADLLDIVKYSGCTLEGLVDPQNSGVEYKPPVKPLTHLELFDKYAALLARSHCRYINRAIETWNNPPDFDAIADNRQKLYNATHRPYVLGAFVAEHVSLTKPFTDREGRYFQFENMCKLPPAEGAQSCYASFGNPEYRRYVQYMVQKCIDAGIQVFLFGGVANTEPNPHVSKSALLPIVDSLKQYAAARGITVLFGAQQPAIFEDGSNRDYADSFDFIQSGLYINPDGSIPDKAQAASPELPHAPPRLWLYLAPDGSHLVNLHKLVVEYDFFNNPNDDSTKMAVLSKRHPSAMYAVMKRHYDYFKSIGVGLWIPYRAPIAFAPWFYTPMDYPLYQGQPQQTNFNDENIISIQPEAKP